MAIYFYDTKIGKVGIEETEDAITRVYFGEPNRENNNILETPLIKRTSIELREYLNGQIKEFTVPVKFCGSDFMMKVWRAITKIPYGETSTYGEIARAIGNPKGARAVGMACNRNPVPIIVPCHRVVGADGRLTGYAGGIGMKEMLIGIEKVFAEVLQKLD